MIATLRANLAATIFGLLAALFAIIAVVQSVEIHGFLWIDGLRDKLDTCQAARVADRLVYEQAQRDAKAKNDADVARIEAEQQRISSDVQSNLNARLERLRSELRNAAVKGSAGRPQAGADGKASGGVASPPAMCLSPEELLRAAEDEERHDQLITWVEKQLGVVR